MTLDPLLDAPAQMRLHIAAIATALVLVPVQLALPKGTPRHRLVGWIWAAAMVLACLSALAILDRPIAPGFGPSNWLHLLAVFTLVMLWRAVDAARRGDSARHRATMTALALYALGIPLIFAVAVPGRGMFRALFGN